MAPRTIGSFTVPGIVWVLFWVLVVLLVLILIAWIIHQAGGGHLSFHIGHFVFDIGVT